MPDCSACRVHAELRQSAGSGELILVDLGSENGTKLNGERLAPGSKVAVKSGDNIVIGEVTLTLIAA